jgi:transposase
MICRNLFRRLERLETPLADQSATDDMLRWMPQNQDHQKRTLRCPKCGEALRVAHDRELYREFLARLPAHSAIAVEASGSYSWLVDEMERSGNPLEAKRRMGLTHKTDKLDARGLAILLRNGTLPEVWIPPGELRDQRELLRLRIFLVRLCTRVKNRIHGTLARHNLQVPGADLFGFAARRQLGMRLPCRGWAASGWHEAAMHPMSRSPRRSDPTCLIDSGSEPNSSSAPAVLRKGKERAYAS